MRVYPLLQTRLVLIISVSVVVREWNEIDHREIAAPFGVSITRSNPSVLVRGIPFPGPAIFFSDVDIFMICDGT